MRAHYPFTAQDEQRQITQIYSTAPSVRLVPSSNAEEMSLFYNENNKYAPPLAFVRLKEVQKLMGTPPHSVVVYFPSMIMRMEGAAEARYAG